MSERRFLVFIRSRLVRGLEWAVIALVALLVVDVLWGVFSRYILGAQSRWTEELATSLLVWISFLGGAVAYEERAHLGLDYLSGKLDPSARRMMAMIAHLIVGVFAVVILLGGGWILVSKTMASGQVTPALGWRMGYVYLAVPISGIFFTLFVIENIWSALNAPTEEVPSSETPEI